MLDAPSSVQTPDETLVRRARERDAVAREELFQRYREDAYRVAYRLLGHAPAAGRPPGRHLPGSVETVLRVPQHPAPARVEPESRQAFARWRERRAYDHLCS